uniref:ResB-like domain-containing protein n=1 Tax=Geobacter sp. (strain M21) TaxID=443144 RepID=C6E615_GEOSM
MTAIRQKIRAAAISRSVAPGVIGFFLLLYVGIAFGSNEPLTTLMAFTRGSVILLLILALVPLNLAARLADEAWAQVRRRRAMAGKGCAGVAPLFDDAVRLPQETSLAEQAQRMACRGYQTRATADHLAAWRGVSLFPARLLFLLGGFCLFAGILLSLTTRDTQRAPVVEGEHLPGSRDLVQRIVLRDEPGLLLERSLEIFVAMEGGGERAFGLYPPARHRGRFLYPRYLGVAPLVRLTAPELPDGFEQYAVLGVYPPGKEDTVAIPDTPYRIIFQMAPAAAEDPYITGRITLQFRVLKEDRQVFAGSAPVGGGAGGNGYSVAFPACRRMVVADFVQDAGVPLIWSAALLFGLALCYWLPVRLWSPRRELLVVRGEAGVVACSRAEGRRRAHAGSFHELLDLLHPAGEKER